LPPTTNAIEAVAQPTADRPRTGTTVTKVTAPATSRKINTDAHAWRCTAQNTGIVAAPTTQSCRPVSPNRNQPTRAFEYSL
jgi:hypothetical protein